MTIPCCLCGSQIEPNALNMCSICTASKVDIAENIATEHELKQCAQCKRYQCKTGCNTSWVLFELESRELLGFCLKLVSNLKKYKIIDANFVWTEPHSKRIKLNIIIQKDFVQHAPVRATKLLTFVIQNIKCADCSKDFHDKSWRAVVQIRQKANPRRTLARLEQEILKSKAHEEAMGIQSVKEGMDLYFSSKAPVERFLQFIAAHAPTRIKSSSKMISEDVRNGTAKIQATWSVQLSPICKDDLLLLPARTAQSLGNISRLVLCTKTTSAIDVLDPFTGQKAEISGDKYWKLPFQSLDTSPHMEEYIVLDNEPLIPKHKSGGLSETDRDFVLADVEVARTNDFGVNDITHHVQTHLGAILSAGNSVRGYDLQATNFGARYTQGVKEEDLPDIVLVRKVCTSEK
uniref:60S ribosomal export protein NMD3 n=1 Tax=Albugo laibachii Nc14 TaxID=890382 RepID=F0W5N7_9STRA|nr:60S ribosomal export protein nmd3 putative [Albugo laibachii Nc14]|eukprot:CCA16428.1 60S ribosomal export protein nmd3 putative [Albugo laibachii Nc14]